MDNNRRLGLGYGVICLILGGIWLLNTMGLLPWQLSDYLHTWRFLLVLIGSVLLVKRPRSAFAMVTMGVGLVSSIGHFWHFPMGWENYLPPIALIVVGLVLLLRNKATKPVVDMSSDSINLATVFGNVQDNVTAVLFKGGYLSCIFGSNTIDMSQAHLGQDEVVLHVFSLFGTNTIIVPTSWEVEIVMTNILGNTKDNSRSIHESLQREGVLRIQGTNVLGNLKVLN